MRFVTVLALMAVVMLVLCSPALPKDKKKDDHNMFANQPPPRPAAISLTVIQGGKRYEGWGTDAGRIFVEKNGRIIMDGWINRTGAVTFSSSISDDTYVGQVNPMGNGLLMSPTTSDTIRIEVQR
jgi:hypothetical protein